MICYIKKERVGDGSHVRFWDDSWIGNASLTDCSPVSFSYLLYIMLLSLILFTHKVATIPGTSIFPETSMTDLWMILI